MEENQEKQLHQINSFSFTTNYKSPKYLTNKELCPQQPTCTMDVLQGNAISENGDFKLTDPQILESQKGIVSTMISKITESVMQGRGIVGVSLPCKMFETTSLVERITHWWGFLPQFMKLAVEADQKKDYLSRISNIVAFICSGLICNVGQRKPFNPILGETYQGSFSDGTQVYCEHTSHHPPISNFLIIGKGFRIYGRYEFKGSMSATFNCAEMFQDGITTVEFDSGDKLTFRLPGIKLIGLIFGERSTHFFGAIKIEDKQNGLKAVVKIGTEKGNFFTKKKQYDPLVGKIYKVKPGVKQQAFSNLKDQFKDDIKSADCEQELLQISGSLVKEIKIGNKIVWNLDKFIPQFCIPSEDVLPSDYRYREDLLWLKLDNLKLADQWKVELEIRQRAEKKFRNDKKAIQNNNNYK